MSRTTELFKAIEEATDWASVSDELKELSILTGYEKEWKEADGDSFEEVYEQMVKVERMKEKFSGWVTAGELDEYFFKKGFRFGMELADNFEIAMENKNWGYEDADVCGYIVHFNEIDLEDGQMFVYVTDITEL